MRYLQMVQFIYRSLRPVYEAAQVCRVGVAAGSTLSIPVNSHYDNCGSSDGTVRYTASGYCAQP
jgi:hypothetical protein